MRLHRPLTLALGFLVLCLSVPCEAADKPTVIDVWPGKPPGDDAGKIGEEKFIEIKSAPNIKWLTNVTKPTLTVYKPAKDKDTGAAALICPGGGYHNLAWDREGEEVAEWLNSLGITGIILKYRVPRRPGDTKGEPAAGPLQDAQRAVSLVRSRAKELGIDPDRVGMIGFSAGGHLVGSTATNFERRSYEPVDDIDKVSCRPDFGIMAYSGYFKVKDGLSPTVRTPEKTPPLFFVHASDDPVSEVEHSVTFYLALKRAKIDTEMHVYASGGHGFGVRQDGGPCAEWTRTCADWMRRQKIIKVSAGEPEKEIIPKGAKLEKVAGDCKFTEGPAADAEGNLFFTDSPRNLVLVLRPSGKVETFDKDSKDANGMRFDAQGRLVACCGEGGARAVVRYEKDGKKTTLADKYSGKRLTAPNDLCFDRQGRVYFTDPCYGTRPRDAQEKYAVYRIEAENGEPVPNKVTRVIDDVDTLNGIALSPDGKTLYVADNAARKDGPHTLVAYDVKADGTCKRRAVLHDFKDRRGIDGMVVDTDGNVYVTAESGDKTGVYIFSPEGKQLGFLRTPEEATNCTFGDKDLKTLYVTAGASVYKVRLNATGFPAYPAPKP